MNFFNKIPTITYNGNLSRNIMARARLSDASKNTKSLFFPYDYSGESRIDVISQQYYSNPGYTWLIWFANETVDPYYDMALNEYDFEQFIISKYGSVAKAQRKISHYKINWEGDTTAITPSAFAKLEVGTQKYWQPVLDSYLNVQGYVRKRDDQKLNTNRIGIINFASSTAPFVVGEEIQQVGSSTIYGFCTYSDSTSVTIQHLQGSFTSGAQITGKESGASATAASVNNIVARTEAYDYPRYWKAVSYYDYELQLNEDKKKIVLLDAMQANKAEQNLIRVMSQ